MIVPYLQHEQCNAITCIEGGLGLQSFGAPLIGKKKKTRNTNHDAFKSKCSPLLSWHMISSVLILPLYRGCAQNEILRSTELFAELDFVLFYFVAET